MCSRPSSTAARGALAAQASHVGALIYVGTRWVRLDLLAGARLFGRAWPRLCAGWVAAWRKADS
jgi:hypothetical protein